MNDIERDGVSFGNRQSRAGGERLFESCVRVPSAPEWRNTQVAPTPGCVLHIQCQPPTTTGDVAMQISEHDYVIQKSWPGLNRRSLVLPS